MDHRLSTTLHERRSRAFVLQGSFSSTKARPQRSNYGKALLFAREARAGGRSRPSLPLDANSPQLSRNPYSCARRSRRQGSLAAFSVRIALSKCISSRSQDRPAFMLLRPLRQTTILVGAFPKLSNRFGEIFAASTRRAEA